MNRAVFDRLLARIQERHRANPELARFAPWPDRLCHNNALAPYPMPAGGLLAALDPGGDALVQAILDAAPFVHWRRTYTEAEVGAEFRDRYGYFELFGPEGHFRCDNLRGYIGFWAPGLYYDWHHHQAEELYHGLIGCPVFHSDRQPDCTLHPGDSRLHVAFENHAMTNGAAPFLTFVLWRGAGLSDRPRMGRAA